MIKIYSLILILSVAFSAESSSRDEKNVSTLTLYRVDGSKVIEKKMSYDKFSAKDSLKIVSPHTPKNPQKLNQHWKGKSVLSLLNENHFPIKNTTPVVFAATDKYSVKLDGQRLTNASPIIATERDGKRLEWRDGGPQLVYPLNNPKLSSELRSDSWWAWYITAVFVGDFPPLLNLQCDHKAHALNLSKLPNVTQKNIYPSYPPGQRLVPPPKGAISVGVLDLKAILAKCGIEKPSSIELETYLSEKVVLPTQIDDLEVRFSWEGQIISPNQGGPIQVCKQGSPLQCTFYVRNITVKSGAR